MSVEWTEDQKKKLEYCKKETGDEYIALLKEYTEGIKVFENFDEKDAPDYILSRFARYLVKGKISMGNLTPVNVSAVIFGVSITDYGARYQFEAAEKAYKEDPDSAIAEGLVDNEGYPIYKKGFRKGNKIDLEKAISYIGHGAFKVDDSDKYLLGQIKLSKESAALMPTWQLTSFGCGLSKQEEGHVWLSATRLSIDKTSETLSLNDIKELCKAHLPNLLVDVNTAVKIANEEEEKKLGGAPRDYTKLLLVKGNLASDGVFITEGSSDMMHLAGELDLDALERGEDIASIAVWMPKDNDKLLRRVKDGAVDVVVVGMPYLRHQEDKGDTYNITAVGMFVRPEFIGKENGEVTPDKAESTTVKGEDGNAFEK